MSRHPDDEDDDFDGDEDADDGDDLPTVECPYCRRAIPEDSPLCSYCERYISREDAPPPARPWWLIAGVAVCLAIVLLWVFGR